MSTVSLSFIWFAVLGSFHYARKLVKAIRQDWLLLFSIPLPDPDRATNRLVKMTNVLVQLVRPIK